MHNLKAGRAFICIEKKASSHTATITVTPSAQQKPHLFHIITCGLASLADNIRVKGYVPPFDYDIYDQIHS